MKSNTNTVNGYEALRLQFEDIPRYYENNDNLLHFRAWVKFHKKKIQDYMSEIFEIVRIVYYLIMTKLTRTSLITFLE